MFGLIEAWFEAIRSGDGERVKAGLEQNPELAHTENRGGLTPLGFAAHFGQAAVVKLLLEHGADVRAISHSRIPYIPSNTALHAALAGERDPEVVHLLLGHGAEPNVRDSNGHTCLHVAAYHDDRTELLAALLHHGAELGAKTEAGETALEIALKQGNRQSAEFLQRQ